MVKRVPLLPSMSVIRHSNKGKGPAFAKVGSVVSIPKTAEAAERYKATFGHEHPALAMLGVSFKKERDTSSADSSSPDERKKKKPNGD